MKKKIKGRVYDTEKAREVGKHAVSYFGDSYGYEEIMFCKNPSEFFLFARGGKDSQYPEEEIIPLSLEEARNWLERITGHDYAFSLIPDITPPEPVKAKKPAAKTPKKAPAATGK
jgi:hypothetical protein